MASRRYGRIGVLAIVVLLFVVASLFEDRSLASEMGFRFNKQICPLAAPSPRGRNWISLPLVNNYTNAQQLCVALAMPVGSSRVLQWNANTGAITVWTCGGGGPPPPLNPLVGVEVNAPVMGFGVLEGSHFDPPAPGIPLFPADGPPFNGSNLYPVPYHSMARTMQDVCVDIGLPLGPARIVRLDACTGATSVWNCGPGLSPALVLGEAVVIDSMPVATAFIPDHF
jgi:hypothetical protein